MMPPCMGTTGRKPLQRAEMFDVPTTMAQIYKVL